MGRTKSQVAKVRSYGVICFRPGQSSHTASIVPKKVSKPITFLGALKDGKTVQTPGENAAPIAEPVTQPLPPISKLPGQRPSVFDSKNVAQSTLPKKRAAEPATERDAKRLKIDGNDRLDPRKAAPAMFDLNAGGTSYGVRTRASMKTGNSGNSETWRSRPTAQPDQPAQKTAKPTISQEQVIFSVAQDASLEGMSRHDSVVASPDRQDAVQATGEPANNFLSCPSTVAPMRGTKRKYVLPSDDDDVQMLSADDEEATTVAKPRPTKTPKRRVRKSELDNLTTDGTTALKCEVTTNSNRFVKEYSVDGGKTWYRLSRSTSEMPDWIEQAAQVEERWVDISRGV